MASSPVAGSKRRRSPIDALNEPRESDEATSHDVAPAGDGEDKTNEDVEEVDEEEDNDEEEEEEEEEGSDDDDGCYYGGPVADDDTLLAIAKGDMKTSHGNCVAAAISKRYIKFKGTVAELDAPVIFRKSPLIFRDRSCCGCTHDIRPTLRQLLLQPDYGGDDYEDGLHETPVRCSAKRCPGRCYVTGLCSGRPDDDDGKFHNHCGQCPGHGRCLGDYREAHCDKCGGHYFHGLSGSYGCPCQRGRGGGGGRASSEWAGGPGEDDDVYSESEDDHDEPSGRGLGCPQQ